MIERRCHFNNVHSNNGHAISNFSHSVEELTFIREPEDNEDDNTRDLAAAIVPILLEIRAAGKPEMAVDALLSMLGDYGCPRSLEATAMQHGVSKQRFSIVRSQISDRFGVKPAGSQYTHERRAVKTIRDFDWTAGTRVLSRIAQFLTRATRQVAPSNWPLDLLRFFASELEKQLETVREMIRVGEAEGQ